MDSSGFKPLTPDERIKYLRREHARVEHPVGHCRKDRQNWPCDVIKGLEAAAEVERDRIAAALQAQADREQEAADAFPGDPGFIGAARAARAAVLIAKGETGGEGLMP